MKHNHSSQIIVPETLEKAQNEATVGRQGRCSLENRLHRILFRFRVVVCFEFPRNRTGYLQYLG